MMVEWFIAFFPRARLRDVLRGRDSWRALFGHVEAYGYTVDDTWVFYRPAGSGTRIEVTHLHDEVVDRIASIRTTATTVFLAPPRRDYRLPLFPPMNCATQVAALIGRRAYSPAGLARILRHENAEIIWEKARETPEGRSSRQGGAPA